MNFVVDTYLQHLYDTADSVGGQMGTPLTGYPPTNPGIEAGAQ
ncbi:hypothetical protein [Mycolicibacterium baixiangningiae]|nr:hypothetical protein [Mycolicibacterium baixiangningiae]